ncbi:MAG: hypothetical protein HZB38_11005 [Planctomycetes bacterium]|nr:hypothetical protein [Planctomycetota bacterium]
MSARGHRLILIAALLAGVGVVGAAGGLVADFVLGKRAEFLAKPQIESLRAAVKKDAAAARELEDEYKRMTAASLAREHRAAWLSMVLVACGAAFVITAKQVRWPTVQRAAQPCRRGEKCIAIRTRAKSARAD